LSNYTYVCLKDKFIYVGYSGNYTFDSATAVFFYHNICQAKHQNTDASFTCFRDMNYLCICEPDHQRAECFGYNRSTDQCSNCLSNGYCLKGELYNEADFVCLCPRCHHGKMCQYSTEVMTITRDSLIVRDVQNSHKYPSVSIFQLQFSPFCLVSSIIYAASLYLSARSHGKLTLETIYSSFMSLHDSPSG
jgi:hypothetical protein